MLVEKYIGDKEDNDVEKRSKIQNQTKVITMTGRIKKRESDGNIDYYENVNYESIPSVDELDIKFRQMRIWRRSIMKDFNDKVFSYALDNIINQPTEDNDDSLFDISEFIVKTRQNFDIIHDSDDTTNDSENIMGLTLKEEILDQKLFSLRRGNAEAFTVLQKCLASNLNNNDIAFLLKMRSEADFKPRFSKILI